MVKRGEGEAERRGSCLATRLMKHQHTVVWVDHREARIFHLDGLHGREISSESLSAPAQHLHRHESRVAEHPHPADALHFDAAIADALAGSEAILIVGPSTAKLELTRHLHKRAPAIEAKVVGVETVDHPTDGQIVAYARKYFAASDKLR
jgi:hypothetical protein